MKKIKIDWEKKAKDCLVGRKIVGVHWMENDEASAVGWRRRAIVLHLDDGNLIYPSMDDEGNDAGALFTNDPKNPCFPVFH
jgi:hypothetical protein